MSEGLDNWKKVSAHVADRRERAIRATEWQNEGTDKNYPILSSGLPDFEADFADEGGMVEYFRAFKAKHGRAPRVLDYGCGTSQLGRDLYEALGEDVSYAGVSAGDPREEDEKKFDDAHGLMFVNQTKAALPEFGTFDIIVSHTTFGHLPDPLRALKQLYDRLNDDGEIRVECPIDVLAKGFYDGKDREKCYSDARTAVQRLKDSGVDLEVGEDGLLKIRKSSESPRELPLENIFSYSPVVNEHHSYGIYTLKE